MTAITLTVQPTANPDIIKLEANRPLVKGSYEYKNVDEAKNAPLAKELFYLPFIKTLSYYRVERCTRRGCPADSSLSTVRTPLSK